jgi:16S rRNA (cytidine1402-2'-O)-methyltransferase
VTIPIGNYDDITLRALNSLKNSEVVICEELKPARKLLKHYGIKFYEGEFDSANDFTYLFAMHENASQDDERYLVETVLKHVTTVAAISDCGSPVFEDPAHKLERVSKGFKSLYIPGVTSLSALMMHLPESVRQFEMMAFPPRKTDERAKFFKDIQKKNKAVFLMGTPYRISRFVEELNTWFKEWTLIFGYRLTQEHEVVLKGRIRQLSMQLAVMDKGEFVLFLLPPDKPFEKRFSKSNSSKPKRHFKKRS